MTAAASSNVQRTSQRVEPETDMQTTTSSNTPWVLVTGGSRGLGYQMVKAFAALSHNAL